MQNIFSFILTAHAQATITINPNIPGVANVSASGPCGWIVGFYNFALIIAGILAFGAIVYGGVKYAISAGNASQQSEGRSWIFSALIGILLLAGAYLILYTVNPGLTKCALPTLTIAQSSSGGIVTPSGGSINTAPPAPTSGTCASGQCQILPNCTPTQGNPVTGAGAINCGGAQGMVNTLTCIQQADPNFSVSEGYPPTVQHTSAGHNNGCSVDTVVSGGCAGVAALQAAATQCGATSLNEYSSCGGKTFGTTTGNNVHINAQAGQGGC